MQLRRGRGLQADQKVWDIWNSVQVGLRLPETNGQEVSRKKTLRSRQRLRTVVLEGLLERGRWGSNCREIPWDGLEESETRNKDMTPVTVAMPRRAMTGDLHRVLRLFKR